MDAFSPSPPSWTEFARHAVGFCCPSCGSTSREAQSVWLNRRAPLYRETGKVWQEFYLCQCGTAWWSWNDERPPSSLGTKLGEE